eukprot:gnl/TRDRNA2_/TRDRNA2_177518_c3_seq22.p1 gnl/TRDRNA2_/TRDRNA2_177518_c3~~gnl/TRDRNA2_/TRDRNA2_177518_c3_seq22.p1  ORF type:complete len:267 (+),score=11.35 gnl/TRDRNA2_/TRDRNA2_177518_c3_seq22:118-801(+)
MPREAPVSQEAFRMLCDIAEVKHREVLREDKRDGDTSDCPSVYAVSLTMTGGFLGNVTSVSFHARKEDARFSIVLGGGVHFVDGHNMTATAIATHLQKVGTFSNFSIAIETNRWRQAMIDRVTVRLGRLQVIIINPDQGLRSWSWLNIQVKGLDTMPFESQDIVGVLGFHHVPNSVDSMFSVNQDHSRLCRQVKRQETKHRITFAAVDPGSACTDRRECEVSLVSGR